MTLAGTHKQMNKEIQVNIIYIHNRLLFIMLIQWSTEPKKKDEMMSFAEKWMLEILVV